MEKLKTNELSLGLNQTFRNDLVDNFKKIQNGVDGQSDALNKQITDLLGDVTPQDQNEVTQARIDVHGNHYGALKSRADATQATAETALSEERDTSAEVQGARTNSSSKTYPTLKARMDNQENDLNNSINNKLSQISSVPETFTNLDAIKAKYPNGKNGLMIAAGNGHKYIWDNSTWTDAGVYQAVGIADNSILQNQIRQPLTRGVIIQGHMTIDSSSKQIVFSNDLAFDVNGEYSYPNTAATLSIPDGTGPVYIYYRDADKSYHVDRNGQNAQTTTTNSDIYIGVIHMEKLHLYGSNSEQFVTYNEQLLQVNYRHADLLIGDIYFDPTAKTLSSTGLLVFSDINQTFSITSPMTLTLKRDFTQFSTYVYFDTVTKTLVEYNGAELPASYIHVATIYQSEIFETDLRHWWYRNFVSPFDRDPFSAPIVFNGTPVVVNIQEEPSNDGYAGTVDITEGSCFVTQSGGQFLHVDAAQHLNYQYLQNDVNTQSSLYSFFWNSNDHTVYGGYQKLNRLDIKLWSMYAGKVYGTSPKGFVYNGVEDGGWSSVTPSKTIPTFEDWQNSAIQGNAGNVAWLGDSTWEGYRVKDVANIFPVYLNTLLPKQFTNVKSFNCSKGGYTTQQLYENFDTLTANAANISLLMIGGGLNDGADVTNSRKWLDKIVQKCYSLGITPIIATTQATALLYTSIADGGDWDHMKQRNFERINQMRRAYASEKDIPLLDFERYTHEFIELSDAKMSDMFVDCLHGMDPIHIYEANLAMAFLSPFCKQIRADKLIGITTMEAESDISYNLVYKPLDTAVDGFKARFKYAATKENVLIKYDCFIPADGHVYALNGFNYGASVQVSVDNETFTLSTSGQMTNLVYGYHSIIVSATTGNIDFAGLKISFK
ncbi:SGNH/GDSL hydrolase family protein [Lactiplantibacillus plantarum]|uniref:SGNH/GDSL hydrolase family protein n=1 Tax=Lactiplantibacillus plantarum TaxID=1590 RepID=UPI0005FB668A|nr:SGNH/GDSL hydrolase family protein [Lactiplantibacillus plantarum]